MKKVLIILFLLVSLVSFSQTKLTAPLVRNNQTDTTYWMVQDSLLKGGYMVFTHIINRDSLPHAQRRIGMLCFVVDSSYWYQLIGGIEDANWLRVFQNNGGAAIDTVIISNNDSIFIVTTNNDTIYIGTNNGMDTAYISNDSLYGTKGGNRFFIGNVNGGDTSSANQPLIGRIGFVPFTYDGSTPTFADIDTINTIATKSDLIFISGADTTTTIVDSISNSPPVGAISGNVYLVGTSPTGLFALHKDQIATLVGATYSYQTPTNQQQLIVDNSTTYATYQYNGTYPTGLWKQTSILVRWGGNRSVGNNAFFGRTDKAPVAIRAWNKIVTIFDTTRSIFLPKFIGTPTDRYYLGIDSATGRIDTLPFHPLIAGTNITISGDTISSTGGGSGGGLANFYLKDSTLSSNRTVTGGSNSLTYNGVSKFVVNSNDSSYFSLSSAPIASFKSTGISLYRISPGTPGTDSILTINSGQVKKIPTTNANDSAIVKYQLAVDSSYAVAIHSNRSIHLPLTDTLRIFGSSGVVTTNALTFNNSGTGDASGTTFNGSAARTLSYNSIGAQPQLNGTGYTKFSGTTPSYVATIPIADGGTNNGSLSVTNGNLIYADGTKLVGLGVGTAGQHLVGGTLPHWVDTSTGGSSRISALTAANATNIINNATFKQNWYWTTLANDTALVLETNSTTAASNKQTILKVAALGANTNATQTTIAGYFANTHTGATSTNIGVYSTASGATNNYAGLFFGNVGVNLSTPTNPLSVSGIISSTTNFRVIGSGTTDFGSGLTYRFILPDDSYWKLNNVGPAGSNIDILNDNSGSINFSTNASTPIMMQLYSNGNLGLGVTSPSGRLHIAAGTTAAGTAPIKLTKGPVLTTPEAGALEYDSAKVFFTNFWGKRQEIAQIQQTRVSTQFDKTSSTALANITGLTANLAAGVTYRFEAIIYTTSNVGGGVQFAIAGTATATNIIYEDIVTDANINAAQTRATALATAVGGVTAVTNAYSKITGTITVNAAGTLTVQFAQNASNGTASSVLVGSNFVVTQIN